MGIYVLGVCVDEIRGWLCECREGWVGKQCQINFNECHSHPCHNGAVCVDEINGFRFVSLSEFFIARLYLCFYI